jgi:hypothetical protein
MLLASIADASPITVTYNVELNRNNIPPDNSIFGEISIIYEENIERHYSGPAPSASENLSVVIDSWTSTYQNIIPNFYTHQTNNIDILFPEMSISASKSYSPIYSYDQSYIASSISRFGYTNSDAFKFSLSIFAVSTTIYSPPSKPFTEGPLIGSSLENTFLINRDYGTVFDVIMSVENMYGPQQTHSLDGVRGKWLGFAQIKNVVSSDQPLIQTPIPNAIFNFLLGLFGVIIISHSKKSSISYWLALRQA